MTLPVNSCAAMWVQTRHGAYTRKSIFSGLTFPHKYNLQEMFMQALVCVRECGVPALQRHDRNSKVYASDGDSSL